MQKKKSRRLQIVHHIAAMQEQKKMLALSQNRLALDQQQQLMQQLKDYAADYQSINQSSTQPTSSATLQRLQNASQFMRGLDNAMLAQAQREQQSQLEWQSSYTSWAQQKARSDALQGVIDTHKKVEDRELENAEERENIECWLQAKNPA